MIIFFILWRVVPIIIAVVVLIIYFKCDEDYFVNKGKAVIAFLSKHSRPPTPIELEHMNQIKQINDLFTGGEGTADITRSGGRNCNPEYCGNRRYD
ncbi:hypothetical protein [Gilliamella sp. BG7]|uniref:hypothetical protein n=1 Tax=unclassified Gilliamella TaxID=2685620 RepID=UPI00398716E0